MTPICALAIVALLPVAGTIPRDRLPVPAPVVTEFLERVAEYVEIRRQAAAGIGGPAFCSDLEELARQSEQRAAAIRNARPLATEGTVFTPRVALFLRARIAHAVRAAGHLTTPVGQPDDVVLAVHVALPWSAGRRLSPALVEALPALPYEVEYRFVGRHLVLVDAEANLVVDVLREALPEDIDGITIRSNGACDVHPDLPECWM
jgi:hypothetical protein